MPPTGDERLRTESKLDKAKGAAHNVAGDCQGHGAPRLEEPQRTAALRNVGTWEPDAPVSG
jgi:hypothetical protein